MNSIKAQSILAGQTALAQKVYEVTPILESWPQSQITLRLLKECGSTANSRAVRACLQDLVDAGLIREQPTGLFRRTDVKEVRREAKPSAPCTVTPISAAQEPAVSATKPSNSLDVLAELSGELTELSKDITRRIGRLASRIEEVALSIEQEREQSAAGLAKVRQLQTLLSDLAQEA